MVGYNSRTSYYTVPVTKMPKSDPLLTPFQLKHLALKNRIISTPHAPAYAEDGMPGLRYQRYHEEKAIGGIGMTMFGGSSCVAPDSPSVFGQLNVSTDKVIPYFQEFAERIHQHDCALICQISHLGRRTVWNNGDWLPVIGPSRIREPAHRAFPKPMEQHDIERVINQYADAALRCQQGGLDGCEILSHGHLPGQFAALYSNDRDDEYGGSLENRLRFSLELLTAVRKKIGEHFILGIRSEMTSDAEHSDQQECLSALKTLVQTGLIDYVSLNFGRIDTDMNLSRMLPAMWSPLAPWVKMAGLFKKELNLPVLHAARITDLSNARHAIDAGLLDLVGMTRAHIADPQIVNKLASDNEHRIRPCVGAGYCIDRIYGEGEALCLHNVATGRERSMPQTIDKTTGPVRKVVVVGGGPAGLEAARVCALRGHQVTLLEASNKLGGQVRIAASASWRKDLIGIVDWYASEIEILGVEQRYNILAERDDILALQPDVVIIATGGTPDTDYFPGSQSAMSVWDALDGASLSGNILVYDDHGQHQAVSCADHLSAQPDTRVELFTPDRHAAAEMGGVNYPEYMKRFYTNGVTVTPDYRIVSLSKSDNRIVATFANEFTAEELSRTFDHVIVEHGTVPVDTVYKELCAQSSNTGITDQEALISGELQPALKVPLHGKDSFALFRVGDAIACRNIHAAIYDSLRLTMQM